MLRSSENGRPVRNPFRSEAEAFRLLVRIVVASVAVAVVDAAAGLTAAVVVAAFAAAAVAVVYLRRGRPTRLLPSAPAHRGPRHERRALLLVEELPSKDALAAVASDVDRLLVVSPAHTSVLRHWLSDVDQARDDARKRADATVERLRSAHVDANGVIGEEDPLHALDDALRTFGGDEIVVVTNDDQLLARLRQRYAIPVSRV
jgi:rRNA-processing protein FCF1